MADPLAVYLNDHLAGSVAAVELIDSLIEDQDGRPLEGALRALRAEITQDQATLREILARVEAPESRVKQATAWLAEKAARIKLALAGREHPGLSLLEGLESLELGIHGKAGLWRALAQVARADGRIDGYAYAALEQRALAQVAQVEAARLEVARAVLPAGPR